MSEALYEPPDGIPGQEITFGLGLGDDEPQFVLVVGEGPKEIPPEFEEAMEEHPDVVVE